jgi:hypothetical protein
LASDNAIFQLEMLLLIWGGGYGMRGSLWYQGDGNANEGRHDVGGNRAEPTAENAGT